MNTNQLQAQSLNNPYISYIAIGLINIVPLIGVLFANWSPFEVVFMYWFENLVIGLFTIARMLFKPQGGLAMVAGGVFMSLFFCVHYGMFCWGHGLFVMGLLGENVPYINDDHVFSSAKAFILNTGLKWGAASMLIAHAFMYLKDYATDNIGKASDEMHKPYRRIIVLHIAIIVGGFLAEAWQSGAMVVMLLLIAFKVFSDIKHAKKEAEEAQKEKPKRMVDSLIENLETAPLGGDATLNLNGQTLSFDNWVDMRDSPQFKQMKKMARVFLSKKDIKRIEQAIEDRIAREEGHSGVILDGEAERVPDNIKVIPREK